MKDIFFYWEGVEPTHKINHIKSLHPRAKFVESKDNIVATAQAVYKKSLTKQFWLIDIDLDVSKTLQDVTTEEWDMQYTHIFSNGDISAFLIPKEYAFSDTEVTTGIFENKKIIETADVHFRPFEVYFYWTGEQPVDKFESIKASCPTAKFIEYKNNPATTASEIKSTSRFFWLLDIDLAISDDLYNLRVPVYDHTYAHAFINNDIFAYLVPSNYQFDRNELLNGHFSNKKIIETDGIYFKSSDADRSHDMYFYWNGIEPTHKFEGVRKIYPNAKFIKYKKNPVNTARDIKSTSKFFWLIDIEFVITPDLQATTIPVFDQQYVHVFVTADSKRAYLVPSTYQYDHIEFIDGHFSNKKMVETSDIAYRPYDIFFLSYDEEAADSNYELLTQQHSATRIHGVKGIFNAHLEAAKQSTTEFFWVVDADAKVQDSFKFDYRVPTWDFDVVHIWNSRNAVNRLEYGYGGIKLIPKFILLMRADTSAVDVTTSIGSKIKLFDEVSNINDFATSPFAAWRAGFREGVKLSSSVISRQNAEESRTRLEVWCHVNVNHPYGDYVTSGAKVGKMFGTKNQHDQDRLVLINDYNWLKERFDEYLMIKKLNQQPMEKLQ